MKYAFILLFSVCDGGILVRVVYSGGLEQECLESSESTNFFPRNASIMLQFGGLGNYWIEVLET